MRKQIDEIDDLIIPLLEKRFLVVDAIKKIKKIQDIPTLDTSREQQIIDKVNTNSKYDKYLKNIYKEVLKQSKEYQNE